mmetsp:Transcript_8182/g.16094  ORF Transcript_8182/g.16094 Transcript_8182/m.16094 type:complete len:202 (-) Transcript_8182:637-1242(-)
MQSGSSILSNLSTGFTILPSLTRAGINFGKAFTFCDSRIAFNKAYTASLWRSNCPELRILANTGINPPSKTALTWLVGPAKIFPMTQILSFASPRCFSCLRHAAKADRMGLPFRLNTVELKLSLYASMLPMVRKAGMARAVGVSLLRTETTRLSNLAAIIRPVPCSSREVRYVDIHDISVNMAASSLHEYKAAMLSINGCL